MNEPESVHLSSEQVLIGVNVRDGTEKREGMVEFDWMVRFLICSHSLADIT